MKHSMKLAREDDEGRTGKEEEFEIRRRGMRWRRQRRKRRSGDLRYIGERLSVRQPSSWPSRRGKMRKLRLSSHIGG
ncbi:hypothetical protein Nepgr_031013 [Nepenthes gracilis]|uniref:Uncharacterized protein n=1 Tax=Nepenthes gracilis TaxID=150966 RepID=A0AAD3TGI3_NEPGR|nr:hypothetical protein Nepgr_031013 [Nepenthes gracilis]